MNASRNRTIVRIIEQHDRKCKKPNFAAKPRWHCRTCGYEVSERCMKAIIKLLTLKATDTSKEEGRLTDTKETNGRTDAPDRGHDRDG